MSSTRRAAPRRLIRPATVIGGLLLLLVVLALLAIPFLSAPGHAEDARAELTAAKDALDAGDTDAAVAAVERARSETDDLQGSVQGIGGDVWSWVPVAGGPVRDVRRLGNALDQLVAVAETGVRILPQVRGEESTLVDDGNVDIDVLEDVIDDLRERVDAAGRRAGRARRRRRLPRRGRRPARRGPRPGAGRGGPAGRRPRDDRPAARPAAQGPRPRREPAVPRGAAQPRRDALLRRHPADVRARRPRPGPAVDGRDGRPVDRPRRGPAPLLEEGQAATRSTAGS